MCLVLLVVSIWRGPPGSSWLHSTPADHNANRPRQLLPDV